MILTFDLSMDTPFVTTMPSLLDRCVCLSVTMDMVHNQQCLVNVQKIENGPHHYHCVKVLN